MFDENIDPGVLPAQLSSNASVTSEHEDADDDGEDFDINEECSVVLESEQAPAADTGRYPQRNAGPGLPGLWLHILQQLLPTLT
jgi:hypothetical protein